MLIHREKVYFLTTFLNNFFPSLLYILQSEVITPEDIMIHLLPTALEYLNMYLQSNSSLLLPVGQCEQHMAVMWAVAFFLLENFEHEIQVGEKSECSDVSCNNS